MDSLRAFAALSVCAFHFVCTINGFIANQSIINFFSIGKYGVHTFFVISGFVLPWSMYYSGYKLKNIGRFLLKRFIRLEPPYIVSLLLAIVLLYVRHTYYVSSTESGFEINLKQLLAHFGYLVPFLKDTDWLNVVYWTLAVEFQYYLFIAVLFFMVIHKNHYVRGGFYVLTLLSVTIADVNFLPHWLPVFVMGILVFQFKSEVIEKKEFFIYALINLLFITWYYPMALLLFVMVPVVFLLYFEKLKVAALNRIGKFSYSLYLMHTLIGSAFLNVMSHHVTNVSIKALMLITAFVFSLATAYLLYFLIEKPSKKFSSGLRFNKNRH